jgi:oxygen-independent coproporphyrinogen-3 oxidase
VHIPFCHKLCYFCGCNKIVTRQQHKADQYLDVLEQEIIHRAPLFAGRQVNQLHWGGGTPTYLNKAQISRLMGLLRSHFNFNAMQRSPLKSIRVKLSWMSWIIYALEGFNRLSMGVQDFNKEVQRLVNREQDEAFIFALLNHAREIGLPRPIST